MKKVLLLMVALLTLGGGAMNAQTKTTLEQLKAANGLDEDWVASVPAAYPLDVKDAVLFGSDASAQVTNADVSKYDYIYFEVKNFTSARAVRVFFWDPTANKRIDYFLKPVADKETADYAANTTVAGNGTYCVQIPAGARLQGAKTPWIQTGATEPYFQFSEIYLTEREVSYIEATEVFGAPAGTTDLNGMTGSGNNVVWDVTYPQKLGNETNWCGDIDSDNKSVDITNYDYLHFEVSSVSDDAHVGLRVFVSKGTNVKDERTILYPHPIAEAADVKNWTETSWITAPGTYVVKISYNNDTHLRGFKTLQGWNQNAGTITVSQVYLSSDAPVDYLPTGKYVLAGEATGSPSLDAALADANAKIYDATGVTGTNLELTPANPNALFVANEGTLANSKNVCVNGNIANLELTDGYPFAFPVGATAAEASYSRAMSNAWGTVCLPFEMASTESCQFYTILGIEEDMLMIEEQATLPAGAPALVNVNNGGFDVTAQDVALKDVQVSNSTYPLIGTYEAKDVAVTDDVNYYAISNNQFVQATSNINLPAFRAYFTAPKSNAANLRIPAGEATAIKALTGEGEVSVVGIYSANGVQQRSLQKGINVVKLSNGATQKILVK